LATYQESLHDARSTKRYKIATAVAVTWSGRWWHLWGRIWTIGNHRVWSTQIPPTFVSAIIYFRS